MSDHNNDRCQAIYDACKALSEHETLAALAGLLDNQGLPVLLAMLATVCAVKEGAKAQKPQDPMQPGETFTVIPGGRC